MTTFCREKVTCAVCGHVNKLNLLGSSIQFGCSDLDFRPSEMYRSTIFLWTQECRKCGYCSGSIAQADERTKAVVTSEEFQALCSRKTPRRRRPNPFHVAAFIAEKSGDLAAAFHHRLHEAWIHDDRKKTARATTARLHAFDLMCRAREEGLRLFEEEGADDSVAVDLLRRAGDFRRAQEVCRNGLSGDCSERMRDLLEFQLDLCSRQDQGTHTMDEVSGKS